MISTFDRRRVLIFVAIAYGIAIALAVVIFLNGGLVTSAPYVATPLGSTLLKVYFLRGEWDRLIGPSTVALVGSMGYALLALLILSSPRALAPIVAPQPVEPKRLQADATTA